MPEKQLTPKQQRFIEEYLIDLNATQAAIRAGYSAKTATAIGHENLTKPNIQEALTLRRQELIGTYSVTPERVIEEYRRLGFSNMADYVEWGPLGVTVKASDSLTPEQASAVSEVTETITDSGRTFRFKLHDKKGALDSLAKHLGMFIEKIDLKAAVAQEVRVVYDDDVAVDRAVEKAARETNGVHPVSG